MQKYNHNWELVWPGFYCYFCKCMNQVILLCSISPSFRQHLLQCFTYTVNHFQNERKKNKFLKFTTQQGWSDRLPSMGHCRGGNTTANSKLNQREGKTHPRTYIGSLHNVSSPSFSQHNVLCQRWKTFASLFSTGVQGIQPQIQKNYFSPKVPTGSVYLAAEGDLRPLDS